MAVGVRGCMEVLSECEANYDHTGAMWVTSIFLGVFALLLLGDCYLTWRALNGALLRDTDAIKRAQEELQSIKAKIEQKREEKAQLDAELENALRRTFGRSRSSGHV